MGLHLRDKPDLAGYRWGLVREVLAALEREVGPLTLAERKAKPLDEFELVGALEVSIAAGLACERRLYEDDHRDWGRFELTESGKAILAARLRKKTPRARALRRLDELLQQCVAVNRDDELPYQIAEVWLAGSLLKGVTEVGDIDLAIRWEPRKSYKAMDIDRSQDYVWELARRRGLPASAFQVPACYSLSHRVCTYALFGRRRSPLFSIVSMDVVIGMHDVCRCVFDASRGGIVTDPVLPHHPASKKRAKNMLAPLQMPEIAPDLPLRPSHASWLRRYDARYERRPPRTLFSRAGSA